MDDSMWWSSSSVNNEGTLDYPDILIAGVGKLGVAYCLDCRLLTNEMFMQIYICSVIPQHLLPSLSSL